MYCKQFVGNTDVEPYQDLESGDTSPPDCPDFSFKFQKPMRYSNIEKDLDKISTCNFCHLALPIKTLEWHEVLVTMKNRVLKQ